MDIKAIIDRTAEPQLYEPGTAVMWTDEYISKQLLRYHIDGSTDVASRNADSIDKTVRWIGTKLAKGSKVLDLGCGPGLYTHRLARLGHEANIL